MLRKVFHQNTKENRLIRRVLVFALLFAALHVALHDLDTSDGGLGEHDTCQVCRLNHVPVAFLSQPLLLIPPQFLNCLSVVVKTVSLPFIQFQTQWTRAPPL